MDVDKNLEFEFFNYCNTFFYILMILYNSHIRKSENYKCIEKNKSIKS